MNRMLSVLSALAVLAGFWSCSTNSGDADNPDSKANAQNSSSSGTSSNADLYPYCYGYSTYKDCNLIGGKWIQDALYCLSGGGTLVTAAYCNERGINIDNTPGDLPSSNSGDTPYSSWEEGDITWSSSSMGTDGLSSSSEFVVIYNSSSSILQISFSSSSDVPPKGWICGGTVYDYSTHFCRDSELVELCGTSTYTATQFCQNGVVKDFCGNYFNYNPQPYTEKQFCQGYEIKDLCGTQTYTSQQFCQEGTNVVKNYCGTATYTVTQFCQVGTNEVKSLCGTQTYTERQFCQEGTNEVKDFCGWNGNTYYSSQFCQEGTNEVKSLCGTTTYIATQFCQSPNVVKNLCGTQTYTATQFCQSSNVVNNVVKDLCGTQTYTERQFCQEGTNEVKDFCGWNGNTYYSSQFCCDGRIGNTSTQFCQVGTNILKDFCGTATYTASESCCGTTVHNTSQKFCQSPNVVKELCGTTTYTATQFCQSPNVVKELCGNKTYIASQFCYNNDKVGDTCGSRREIFDPDLYECRTGDKIYLKQPVTHGGENYEAVLIGTQTWLTRNLNYNVSGSVCYGNNASNCTSYGRLYNWAMAMDFLSTCNQTSCASQMQAKHKGICPSGWHIPSSAEWATLENYVGGATTAGKYLKATSLWGATSNGTDDYGFSALPGGISSSGGYFSGAGSVGYWWNSNEYGSDDAIHRMISDESYRYYTSKAHLFSVRCLND